MSQEQPGISEVLRETLMYSLLPTPSPNPQQSPPRLPPSRRLSKSQPDHIRSQPATQRAEPSMVTPCSSRLRKTRGSAPTTEPKQEQEILSAADGGSYAPILTPSRLRRSRRITDTPTQIIKTEDSVIATPSLPDPSEATAHCSKQVPRISASHDFNMRRINTDNHFQQSDDDDFMDRGCSRQARTPTRKRKPHLASTDEDRIEKVIRPATKSFKRRKPLAAKRRRTHSMSQEQDNIRRTQAPVSSTENESQAEHELQETAHSCPYESDIARITRLCRATRRRRRLSFAQSLTLGSRSTEARSGDTALAARVCAQGGIALQVVARIYSARPQSGTSRSAQRSRERGGWLCMHSLEMRIHEAEAGAVRDAVQRLITARIFETASAASHADLRGTAGAVVALLQREPLVALCKLLPGGETVWPRNKADIIAAIRAHLGTGVARPPISQGPICSQPPPLVRPSKPPQILVQTTIDDEPHGQRVARAILTEVGLCVRLIRRVREALQRLHDEAETGRK